MGVEPMERKKMDDLISRKALLEKAWEADTQCGYVQVVDVGDIEDAPTIDPMHAAGACYCRECRNYNKPRLGWCSHHMDRENPDDFCSWGQRREDTK